MCIFVSKKRKKEAVYKWLKEHESMQFYIAEVDVYGTGNKQEMVGDATGPMNINRYMTIDDFYNNWVKKIK